jgi:hypothetical protein
MKGKEMKRSRFLPLAVTVPSFIGCALLVRAVAEPASAKPHRGSDIQGGEAQA